MTALACRSLGFTRTGHAGGEPVAVLSEIDAVFESGSVTLISGPTGVGKTTLLHLLAGLLRPTMGEVCWGTSVVSRWHSNHLDRWRRRVGIVFQHQQLLMDLSAGENVLLPLIPRKLPLATQAATVEATLRQVGLAEKAARSTAQLSGGERQRLALARAMAGKPAILLADEPTAFQDDAWAERLIQLLRAERNRGAVVIACSHDPRLLQGNPFDQHCRLDQGRLGTA